MINDGVASHCLFPLTCDPLSWCRSWKPADKMVLGKSGGGLSIWYTTPGRWELLPSDADQSYKGSELHFLVLWRNFVWLCFWFKEKETLLWACKQKRCFWKWAVVVALSWVAGAGVGRAESSENRMTRHIALCFSWRKMEAGSCPRTWFTSRIFPSKIKRRVCVCVFALGLKSRLPTPGIRRADSIRVLESLTLNKPPTLFIAILEILSLGTESICTSFCSPVLKFNCCCFWGKEPWFKRDLLLKSSGVGGRIYEEQKHVRVKPAQTPVENGVKC